MASALAVAGTTAWLFWPGAEWRPDGEPTFFLLAALGNWLFWELVAEPPDAAPSRAAIVPTDRTPHPHDVRLFARFNETLTVGDRAFLREHNFRTPFDTAYLDGLEVVADEWKGADFEFHDGGLQVAFRRFQREASELLELTARYLYPSDLNGNIATPLTDVDRAGGTSPETVRRIKLMNDKATATMRQLDVFIRLARDILERPGAQEPARPAAQ